MGWKAGRKDNQERWLAASGEPLKSDPLRLAPQRLVLFLGEFEPDSAAADKDSLVEGLTRLYASPTSTAFSRFCRFDEGKCFVFNKSWSKEQNSDE
jgi:hypothetical protein